MLCLEACIKAVVYTQDCLSGYGVGGWDDRRGTQMIRTDIRHRSVPIDRRHILAKHMFRVLQKH